MTKKKLTALVLALAMTVGLTQGAFAAEPGEITEEQIQAEIQARTEEVYDLVYEQLEAQDAVDMIDSYMDIFIPSIEFEVMMKYNNGMIPYDDRMCVFAYGGMVSFTKVSNGDEVVDTYLDAENSYAYILEEDTLKVGDVLTMIIGYIPVLGTLTSTICNIQTIISKTNKQSIKNANGFARITNIYNPSTGKKSSVCIGWSTHPTSDYYDIDECENFEREFFPETHPLGWE